MNKLFTALLFLCVILSMSITAFASEQSLTVNASVEVQDEVSQSADTPKPYLRFNPETSVEWSENGNPALTIINPTNDEYAVTLKYDGFSKQDGNYVSVPRIAFVILMIILAIFVVVGCFLIRLYFYARKINRNLRQCTADGRLYVNFDELGSVYTADKTVDGTLSNVKTYPFYTAYRNKDKITIKWVRNASSSVIDIDADSVSPLPTQVDVDPVQVDSGSVKPKTKSDCVGMRSEHAHKGIFGMKKRNDTKSVSDYYIDRSSRLLLSCSAIYSGSFFKLMFPLTEKLSQQVPYSYVVMSVGTSIIGWILGLLGIVALLYSIIEFWYANPSKSKRDYILTLKNDSDLMKRIDTDMEPMEDLIERLLIAHFNEIEAPATATDECVSIETTDQSSDSETE